MIYSRHLSQNTSSSSILYFVELFYSKAQKICLNNFRCCCCCCNVAIKCVTTSLHDISFPLQHCRRLPYLPFLRNFFSSLDSFFFYELYHTLFFILARFAFYPSRNHLSLSLVKATRTRPTIIRRVKKQQEENLFSATSQCVTQ